jgi:O-antigen/teichoic acid export membrane protein
VNPVTSGWRAALGNLAWLALDRTFGMLATLLVGIFVARHYGPTGAAVIGYGQAIFQIGLALAFAGSAIAFLPRWSAGKGSPAALANLFVVRLVGCLLALALLAAIAWWWNPSPYARLASAFFLATVLFVEPWGVVALRLHAENRFRLVAGLRAAGLVARIAVVALVIVFDYPVYWVAAAWLADGLVWAALSTRLAFVRYFRGRFPAGITLHRTKAFAAHGLKFFPAMVIMYLFMRIDRVLLSGRLDESTYGVYAATMQLVDMWAQIGAVVSLALGPAFLFRHLQRAHVARQIVFIGAAFAAAGGAALVAAWWFGEDALHLLYGRDFAAGQATLLIGMVYATLMFADQAVVLWLATLGQGNWLTCKWAVSLFVVAVCCALSPTEWLTISAPIGMAAAIPASWLVLGFIGAERLRMPVSRPSQAY